MASMTDGDESYTYSVAWFDAVTRGKHLGRAVLTRGDKAKLSDLPTKLRSEPLKFVAPSFGTIPEVFPNRMVNMADGQGVQRVLVPQGTEAPGRRDPEHHHVLPPARHRGRVEPGLRTERLPAVPVRRPVRRARDVPPLRRADRHVRAPVLPERAQAVRSRQRRPAVLPDAGLDAHRRPAHRGRSRPALQRSRRAGRGRRWSVSTWPRTPVSEPAPSGRCTRDSTTSWRFGSGSIPATCSPPTSARRLHL